MAKRKLFRNTLRSAVRSKERFLSLFGIIAISTGFFSGLKVTGRDMKSTADRYYRETGLMDLHLRSTAGFSEEELSLLAERSDVAQVCGGYQETVFMPVSEHSSDAVVRIYSLTDSGKKDGQQVNQPVLTEGRMPERANECLIEVNTPQEIAVGDTVTAVIPEDAESLLKEMEFTVVGRADSSMYVDFERGTSTIGNGRVDCFLLVPPEAFDSEVYTDVWLLLNDTAQLDSFDERYLTVVKEHADDILAAKESLTKPRIAQLREELGRTLEASRKELDDGRKQYEDGLIQLDQSLKEGKSKIQKAEKELKEGREALDEQLKEYKTKSADYDKKIAQFDQQIKTAETQEKNGNASLERLRQNADRIEYVSDVIEAYRNYSEQPPYGDDIQKLINEMSAYDNVDLTVSQAMYTYFSTPGGTDEKYAQADAIQGHLYNARVGILNEIVDVDDSTYKTSQNVKKLRKDKETFVKENQEIENVRKELDQKEKELTDAQHVLTRQKNDLEKTEKIERIRLEDAKQTLDDGEAAYEKSLATLENVNAEIEWYAFDRSENPGWSSYGDDTDRVDRIARIFPVFFLLVASLVCLTTVTRMVEEQRTEIGTCKALGYSGFSIIRQYLVYAVLASVLGTAAGTLIGDQIFPRVIFRCYGMMYRFPQIQCSYSLHYGLICLAAALICTGVTAIAACASTMREMPASLMRPKPPKTGKRVLLEHWKWFWQTLGFHTKVTIRNFSRYRARLFMTLLGICGCTALLVTGFGLYHSIAAIVDLQYEDILIYDAAGIYDGSNENRDMLRGVLTSSDDVADWQFGAVRSCTVRSDNKKYEVTVTVPEYPDAFSEFMVLRDRKTKEQFTLTDDGIILNEKLAKLLHVSVGDRISISEAEEPAVVTAIAENYALNRIWMTQACSDRLFGKTEKNCVFINENPGTDEDALAEHLLGSGTLMRLDFTSRSGDSFRKLVRALGYVVAVIIVFSGLLAFVVLYNLANINILERRRELATVKVLGFYDKEVYAYVLRENILSAVLGMAAGLVAGVFLCRYVVVTAEVDVVMFAPEIPWYCFALAAAMTILFTLLVNLLLRRKLRAIDMAGSMKAIE